LKKEKDEYNLESQGVNAMKKIINLLSGITLILALTACGTSGTVIIAWLNELNE
jgi:hypothetical protein